VVLGEEVELRLRRAVAAAGLLARADGDARLVLLVALARRVVRRVEERGEARLLVIGQDADAHRRGGDEHERDRHREQRQQAGEVPPRGPRHEQHRQADDDVDDARAEVLGDDHAGRDQRQQHDPRGRPAVAQRADPLDREAGERDDEQDLAELGELHLERAELDRAARAARHRAEQLRGEHPGDDRSEQADAPLAQPRDVQPREDDGRQRADREEGRLALEVVARVAGDVVLGRVGDRHERAGAQAGDRQRQDRVEGQRQAEARRRRAGRRRRGLGVADRRGDGGAHSAFLDALAVNVLVCPNHSPSM
jgi:hypothetical protein